MGSMLDDVVHISSDEEEDFDSWLGKVVNDDEYDWVSDLFAEDGSGSDIVEVMEELSAPAVTQKKRACNGVGGDEEDDDDDIEVLESNPDKVVLVASEKKEGGVDDGSDEIEIVGEKGEIACRDFPHARHLCSNFPFSSTSHEKHCKMCHCFICDCPAPCSYWGNGHAVTDHCEATDKDGRWKVLRQGFKHKVLSASELEKLQNSILLAAPPSQDPLQLPCPVSAMQPLPSLRSNIIRPCFAGRTPGLNMTNQNQQPPPPIRVSPQLGRAICLPRVSPTGRIGRTLVDAYVTQLDCKRPRFKRAGVASPVSPSLTANNRSQSGFPNNGQMQRTSPQRTQMAPMALRPHRPQTMSTNFSAGPFLHSPSLRSYNAPLTSPAPQNLPMISPMVHNAAQLSRSTFLPAQRQNLMPESLADVSSHSWSDILAGVASDLGVSDYSKDTTGAQQPLNTSLQTPQYGPLPSPLSNATQRIDLHSPSAAGTPQVKHFDPGNSLLNQTGGQNIQTLDTRVHNQVTEALHLPNSASNLAPGETLLNNFTASPGEDMLMGVAQDLIPSKLDSPELMFDFELNGWPVKE